MFLFGLAALVPSVASANYGYRSISGYQICTQNGCQAHVGGQAAYNEMLQERMPVEIDVYCSGASTCSMTTPQQWIFFTNGTDYQYTVANPVQGQAMSYSPPPVLNGKCWQVSNSGTYNCSIGTGGPVWYWTLTASYF
jgi:hypothetical protein